MKRFKIVQVSGNRFSGQGGGTRRKQQQVTVSILDVPFGYREVFRIDSEEHARGPTVHGGQTVGVEGAHTKALERLAELEAEYGAEYK